MYRQLARTYERDNKIDIIGFSRGAALARDFANEIYRKGIGIADEKGIIIADTKFEFGLIDGALALIDEVHTPDSSRYWILDTYQPGSASEPKNFDKEFLRKWFAERGYRGEGSTPEMPAEFIEQVSERYISAYERLTEDEQQRRRVHEVDDLHHQRL